MTTSGRVTVAWVVAQGKREVARVLTGYDGGRLVDVRVARPDDPGGSADAAVTFTLTRADAEEVRDGGLDPSVAFMRGQMKMSGDFGVLLAVLPITRGDEHRAALGRALTEAL